MTSAAAAAPSAATPKLEHVLDDLCTRFLLNLPASEFESFERLFFAVESAHWFYDDFYRENHASLPRLPLKAFAQRLFDHTPLLQPYSGDVDALVAEFKMYKQQVPTCGAAMLNPALDKVLLVRGWGSGAKWGFPKGKMAKDESELQAAIREVHEETGFDFTPYADASTYYIDSMMCGRLNRIFVVPGVPETTRFETQTRKEISKIDWIPVSALPDYKDKQSARSPPKGNGAAGGEQIPANKFVHVHPYTSRLQKWIKRQRKARARTNANPNANGNGASASASASAAAAANGVNQAATAARTKEANGRQPKTNGEGSTGGPRLPEGSPKSKRNRKNRKRHDTKDVETFGLSGGARALTDAERDQMFQSYVKEADRRARELKLGEDEWVSSGRRMPRSPLFVAPTTTAAQALPPLSLFTFNSDAILARMNKAGGDV